ncbi:MAG TPA: hypothetical protein ENI55_01145 [Alphaproteobacteria bacterium]|nr:hypothetical protein [Alphaproteobacteria bacterium]
MAARSLPSADDRDLGISRAGIETALSIKDTYKSREPLCVPGRADSILMPETLLNEGLDLQGFGDPLALAVMAARDPEAPMAMAAAARLSPLGRKTKLVSAVVGLTGEMTRHPLVKNSISLITDHAFSPEAVSIVRRRASKVIVHTRAQYTAALRQNLRDLLQGSVSPRAFVKDFFQLTEAGNMRTDIRKKLIISLLLSDNIRPGIKFMMLENFERMPKAVRLGIVAAVLKAQPSRHTDIIKEELKWIVTHEGAPGSVLTSGGRPTVTAPGVEAAS